jgi:serine/threonine protein kinase
VSKEGKKFAVKIIDKAKVKNEKQRWRIQNEIALHKRCNHSNIVKLLEYYESDIDICLVLELYVVSAV